MKPRIFFVTGMLVMFSFVVMFIGCDEVSGKIHIPVAYDQSITTISNTPVNITLEATDEDGHNLIYAVDIVPEHGILTGNPPDLTYTPKRDYDGSDSFTFHASDGYTNSNTATVSISVERTIDITGCTPNPVDEGVAVSCVVIAEGGTPEIDAANDTCGGTISVTAPWTYDFNTDEADGPGSCVVAVQLIEDPTIKRSEVVTINEVNQAPAITSVAPTAATEDLPYTYNATATDVDLPPNSLTWSLAAGDTCGGSIDPATGVYTFTPTGPIPPSSCDLNIRICDNGNPVLCDTELATINITAVNDPPLISSSPADATENTAYTHNITCTDPEGDTLTLSLSAGNTCGGSVNDSGDGTGTYSGWTPDETQGGTTCVVGITCSDAQDPVDQDTTIDITEDNQQPVWNPAPGEIWVFTDEVHNADYGHATDADIPAQTLTCSKVGSDTCTGFDVTVSGNSAGVADCNFSFTASSSPEVCSVDVQVSDGYGGVVSQNVTIHVESGPCVLRVDAVASGTGTGFSWANAFPVLQDAVDRAYTGCQVWVKEGTYTTGDLNPVITMKDGVDMYGGFVGTENALGDRPGPALLSHSVIDGQRYGKHTVIGASYTVFDGFEVQRGGENFIHFSDPWKGGGMFNRDLSDLTIYNCIFHNNFAGTEGGAMWNESVSNLFIDNCNFYSNGSFRGGGIRNYYAANLAISNSFFSDNYGIRDGGAITSAKSSTKIYDSIFDDNDRTYHGGAIADFRGYIRVDNCDFTYNEAYVSGGAIANFFTDFHIHDSYFYYNETFYIFHSYRGSGGAIFISNGPTDGGEISNCILKENYAYLGGGIYQEEGSTLLSNNLIVKNWSSYGGGLFLDYGSQMDINNTTIADNTAIIIMPGKGGGIFSYFSEVSIENSIVWGNYDDTHPTWAFYYSQPSEKPNVVYSDVMAGIGQPPYPGAGNINNDPFFIGPDFYDITVAEGTSNTLEVADGSIYEVDDVLRIYYYIWPVTVIGVSGNTVTIDDTITFASTPAGIPLQNWGPGVTEFVYDYHLSQLPDQVIASPCVNTGNPTTPLFGTTSTDGGPDTNIIDMGYHYPIP